MSGMVRAAPPAGAASASPATAASSRPRGWSRSRHGLGSGAHGLRAPSVRCRRHLEDGPRAGVRRWRDAATVEHPERRGRDPTDRDVHDRAHGGAAQSVLVQAERPAPVRPQGHVVQSSVRNGPRCPSVSSVSRRSRPPSRAGSSPRRGCRSPRPRPSRPAGATARRCRRGTARRRRRFRRRPRVASIPAATNPPKYSTVVDASRARPGTGTTRVDPGSTTSSRRRGLSPTDRPHAHPHRIRPGVREL